MGYFVTGGLAAVVDAGGFALLRMIGLVVPVAALLSFMAAALVNYLLTSRLVFRQSAEVRRGAAFFAFAVLGMVVNVTLTTVLVAYVGLVPELAKILAIGITFGLNFTLNYLIVFRPHRAD
jgi:putative flippase GtrA